MTELQSLSVASNRDWKPRFLLFAVLATGAGLTSATVLVLGTRANTRPGLSVPESCLSLGDVWEDSSFRVILPISNSSRSPIRIDEVATSCTCTSVTPRAFTLQPQETQQVEVTIDLTGTVGQRACTKSPFSVKIMPHIADSNSEPLVWTVHGTVWCALNLSMRSIDLGNNLVQGSSFPVTTIPATATETLAHLGAECNPAYGTVNVREKLAQSVCQEFELEIILNPLLPPGNFAFPIALSPVLRSGDHLPRISISVTGCIRSNVAITPDILLFYDVPLEGTNPARESVILSSLLGTPLTVDAINVDCDEISVTPTVSASPVERLFNVDLRPSKPGIFVKTIKFLVRTTFAREPKWVSLMVRYEVAPDRSMR